MCEIRIIDDTTFEIDESFKVKVKALFGGKVDQSKSQSVVTIRNDPRDGKFIKYPYFEFSFQFFSIIDITFVVYNFIILKGDFRFFSSE